MQITVGILGLGIMGSAMSGNMLKAGFRVVGFDVDAGRLADFKQAGGETASSPREVAEKVDIIVSVLPSTKALDESVPELELREQLAHSLAQTADFMRNQEG